MIIRFEKNVFKSNYENSVVSCNGLLLFYKSLFIVMATPLVVVLGGGVAEREGEGKSRS